MAWSYDKLVFTGHALRQMFARRISPADVRAVLQEGQIIADYPNDTPYPSRLILGRIAGRTLHVVVAYDERGQTGYIVTAYEPDPDLWNSDFRTRRHP